MGALSEKAVDTYEYVLAEQVADWLIDNHLGKGYFETVFHGADMSVEGLLLVEYVLKQLREYLPCHDYSMDKVDDMGNVYARTALFLKTGVDEGRVYSLAVEAVRQYHTI